MYGKTPNRYCLIERLLLNVHSNQFHSRGEVTIRREGLQNYVFALHLWLSREGCQTYGDQGPRFCDPNFLSTIRSPCATRQRYQGPTVTKILVEPEQLSISDTSYQCNSITHYYTLS